MASPVDTTVKWARSDMPGAPLLTRAAGSMAALLDALLVDGWGTQATTSVVVASGVATATFATDHAAALHSVVGVTGATGAWADLNGEQKITSASSNTLQWATALPDGTATVTSRRRDPLSSLNRKVRFWPGVNPCCALSVSPVS